MPNFELANQPRSSVVTIDTDEPITREQLCEVLEGKSGVTLCIRSRHGHPQRGGYFFCIHSSDEGDIVLETMEQVFIASLSVNDFLRFANHASGLRFDKDMQLFCQNSVNFRDDE